MMVYIGIKKLIPMNEKKESTIFARKTELNFFAYEKEKLKIMSIQQQITVFFCPMTRVVQMH